MNTTIYIEWLGQVHLYLGLGIQTITATVLGGLIGFDREQKMKAAGIKTNMLICLGAMIYTALSMLNVQGMPVPSDPNRVSAQIVSGIGFLGAGAIIQARGNIIGLTTAASIWVVAAIGFTVGMGYPVVATVFTVTILLVLRYFGLIVKVLESEKYERKYYAEVATKGDAKEVIIRFLGSHASIESYQEEYIDEDKDRRLLIIHAIVNWRNIPFLEAELSQLVRVHTVKFLELNDD